MYKNNFLKRLWIMIPPKFNKISLGEFNYCLNIDSVEFPKAFTDDMFCLISENEERDNMNEYYDNMMNELNSLKAENKRLKAQLKELREFKANVEKSHKDIVEQFEKALNESPLNPDKLEESIDSVCSRTLCSRKEALDYLIHNDYNVDRAITLINWSKLNVPSVIL